MFSVLDRGSLVTLCLVCQIGEVWCTCVYAIEVQIERLEV